MKKIIKVFLFVALLGFNIRIADASISNATKNANVRGSSNLCNTGICYQTMGLGGKAYDNGSHIGLRFSLVNKNNGDRLGNSVDILSPKLKEQLSAIGGQITAFEKQISKMEIANSSWFTSGAGPLINQYNVNDIINRSPDTLTGYFYNFNDIYVYCKISGPCMPSDSVYNKILKDDLLVKNYNASSDSFGDVFNPGQDRGVFNYIVFAMLGLPYGDGSGITDAKVEEEFKNLNEKGYAVEIEIITIISYRALNWAGYLYGTTAEIRAMTSQIMSEQCNYDWSGSANSKCKYYWQAMPALFDDPSTANQAVTQLNRNFNADISIGGKPIGSKSFCTNSKAIWTDSDYYACGVGIIDLAGLVQHKSCEVEKDADGTLWYYDEYGTKLNDNGGKFKETFINACMCDVTARTKKEKYGELEKYFIGDTEEEQYIETWCNPSSTTTNPKEKSCEVEVNERKCYDGSDEDTIDETYTFTVGNKNIEACVLDSINTATYTGSGSDRKNYTQHSNNYCQIACAENFKITMPTKKSAKAGTYFDFNSGKEKIEIDGNRICSSKVDYDKFYTDMFNNNGEDSPIDDLSYDFGNRGIQDTSTFEIKTNGTEYTGGLDQQVRDYTQLVNYFKYFSDSDNYSSSPYCAGSYTCGDFGNSCCAPYTKYYSTVKQGGKEVSCTTNNEGCSEDSLASSYSTKLTAAEDALRAAITARNTIISEVNECTDKVTNSGVNVNSARVDYDYDEKYSISSFKLTYSESKQKTIYCDGLIYDSGNNTFTCKENVDPTKKTITGIYNCTSEDCKIYKIPYTAKLDTKIKRYESDTYFFTNPGTGIVQKSGTDLTSLIGNVMPIKLNNVGGRFNYNFTIKNLGDYLRKQDVKYACYYDVGKDVTINKDRKENDKLNFFYRNVSLNNFDPNNREGNNQLGYNWNTEKGKKTMCLITGGTYELDGTCTPKSNTAPEEIYDEKAEYSFTLTPEKMKEIRSYNKTQQKYGGFNDFNMTKIENEGDGYWYTSDFIRNSSYFDIKNSNINPEWELWDKDVAKLSGIGPAWK